MSDREFEFEIERIKQRIALLEARTQKKNKRIIGKLNRKLRMLEANA